MHSPLINPTSQTHLLSLLSEAGWVAKFVLLVLFSASVLCWAIIVTQWRRIQLAQKQDQKFIAVFWNGKNIDEIVGKSDKFPYSPVASVFKSGVKELRKVSGGESSQVSTEKIENIHRALLRAASVEISNLEKNLSWLATTASAAPFVGLFGTVWGIMNAFQSIGLSGAANLAVVAPGISEALITTATGIGAAIPAVVFYNYFVGRIKRVVLDIDCFSQDFVNIVQRSFLSNKKGSP
jgi:biopolymer transport protein TolQ